MAKLGGRVFERLLVWEDPAPRDARLQMALDETLLEGGFVAAPLLRHYRWQGRPVTFGFAGSLAAARREAPGADLVRRWTGGGIVWHGEDWTFSLIVPASHVHRVSPARRSYALLHGAVVEALADLGKFARLAGEGEARGAEACFRGLSCHDAVNEHGQKICGGAQRRSRAGLLHQGSLRAEGLPEDFPGRLGGHLAQSFENYEPPSGLWPAAEELAARRYASGGWLGRVA